MGMPAGGRFSSGHASHQTGLDVDIWLRFGPMDDETARDPAGLATLMVDRDRKIVDERVWTPGQFNLIKLAAQDSRVNRIFVNPAIKVKLCNSEKADRDWLQKIRPWYGHDSHIHVRLSCPQDAKIVKIKPLYLQVMAVGLNCIRGSNQHQNQAHQNQKYYLPHLISAR